MIWHAAVDKVLDAISLRSLHQSSSDGYLIAPMRSVDEGHIDWFCEKPIDHGLI
jgi:hypothetical protein